MDCCNFISWNARGLGFAIKKSAVSRIRKEYKPNFLLLQESKLEDVSVRVARTLWGGSGFSYSHSPSLGASGGIISIWDSDFFKLEDKVVKSRFLAVIGILIKANRRVGVINIYASNNARERDETLSEIEEVMASFDVEWCIGGDFNSVRSSDDRYGSSNSSSDMSRFNYFIDDNGLFDFPLNGGLYTWRKLNEEQSSSRIDRFLVSQGFLDIFSDLLQIVLPRSLSDHNPIRLCQEALNWGPKPFKFYNFWLDERDLDGVVRETIEANQGASLGCILKNIKAAVKSWRKDSSIDDFSSIPVVENKIQELELELEKSPNTVSIRDEIGHLQAILWDLYWKQERKWRQISKLKWAVDGNRNTRFYQQIAAARKRANYIASIQLDGELVSQPMQVKSAVRNHFEQVFSTSDTLKVKELDIPFKSLSSESANFLECPFTEEEVLGALRYMGGNKAPGPDGFTASFFRKYWPELKGIIMESFNCFHQNGYFEKSLNHSFLTLIPKVVGSVELNDLRPISLMGGAYRILSKVLANRLANCVGEVIGETQFGFIPGRQLLDCSLIANETIDFLRSKKLKGVIFKADFRKAYDSVDWKFLDFVMTRMGFGSKWRKWMMYCISSASISVLVNGATTERFEIRKGLRQGCSLSPHLFNLVAQALSLLLKKSVSVGLFEGVKIGQEGPMVSHLQFVDDLIIFCGGNFNEIMNVKRVLQIFGCISGLNLNMVKTHIYGVNLEQRLIQEWAGCIGCAFGSFPTSYLGLPLGAPRNSVSLWQPVIDRVRKRLEGWKGRLLSAGGRLTLVKSVLTSLPVFYLSLFRMPVSVVNQINSMIARFLWGGSGERCIHWVAWPSICLSQDEGGLGIVDMRTKNVALLFKWRWRFGNESNSFWKAVIKAKYEEGDDNLQPKSVNRNKASWLWRGILDPCQNDSLSNIFFSNLNFQLGSGEKINFWSDPWVDSLPLKNQFPRIFALSNKKEGKVADFGNWLNGEWVWNIPLRRQPFAWEMESWHRFKESIERRRDIQDMPDCISWTGASSSNFSTKDFCKIAGTPSSNDWAGWKLLWKGLVPPKVELFSWKVLWERVPTRVELKKRSCLPSQIVSCPFCDSGEETVRHLFFGCYRAWRVWQHCVSFWNRTLVLHNDPKEFFLSWYFALEFRSDVWIMLFHVVIWSLWLHRNSIVFEQKSFDANLLIELILARLGLWCKAKWPAEWISMQQFRANPSAFVPKRSEKIIHGDKKSSIPAVEANAKCFVDASVLGNPGSAGIGVRVFNGDGLLVESYSKYIGVSVPTLAEMVAVREALVKAKEVFNDSTLRLEIFSDCLYIVSLVR